MESPALLAAVVAVGCGLSLLFALGRLDRAAALCLLPLAGLWLLWRRPGDVRDPVLVATVLLAHLFVPPAPYGSWAARGRPDPAGPWRMPPRTYAAVWVILALATAFGGLTRLLSSGEMVGTALLRWGAWGVVAIELAFPTLALVPRVRPWLWAVTLVLRLAPAARGDFAAVSAGMVLLHGLAFDPAWVPRRGAGVTDRLFYDGRCGLCHRTVRFVLAEDRAGDGFRLAPLESDAFRAAFPAAQRAGLPESLVVQRADSLVLTRSAAVLHILQRLGGIWRVLAAVASCVPGRVRDGAYDGIASIRYRLFRPPPQACPLVPPHLQARFDA